MSRFFSERHRSLAPYVPGEQPRDMQYVKLNTNESPFAPPQAVLDAVREAAAQAHLYPDPAAAQLTAALAARYGVDKSEVILGNGSDEILNFAFMAFCDTEHGAAFPDITYGFYPVFAALHGIPFAEVPLREDFTIGLADYAGRREVLFIANPNAPTGIALPPEEIEALLAADPNRLVVVDEAYVDFGARSCVPLIHVYDNLLVVQTFSKSRSLAGARLGMGFGCGALIADLHAIRNSTNPYNVSRMGMAAGLAMLACEEEMKANCAAVAENRAFTAAALRELGFSLTPSTANFVFAAHPAIGGEELYLRLKERGVLVRHFSLPRIRAYNRITIGTREQMQTLLAAIQTILEEKR